MVLVRRAGLRAVLWGPPGAVPCRCLALVGAVACSCAWRVATKAMVVGRAVAVVRSRRRAIRTIGHRQWRARPFSSAAAMAEWAAAAAQERAARCSKEVLPAPWCSSMGELTTISGGRVIAVEIDPQLQPHLQESLGHCRNLDLRIGDALAFPFETLPLRTVVVANLPYYVSTPILFALLDARARLDRLVLMLQTEVALRMAAKPNSEDYGVLSVLTQEAAEVELARAICSEG